MEIPEIHWLDVVLIAAVAFGLGLAIGRWLLWRKISKVAKGISEKYPAEWIEAETEQPFPTDTPFVSPYGVLDWIVAFGATNDYLLMEGGDHRDPEWLSNRRRLWEYAAMCIRFTEALRQRRTWYGDRDREMLTSNELRYSIEQSHVERMRRWQETERWRKEMLQELRESGRSEEDLLRWYREFRESGEADELERWVRGVIERGEEFLEEEEYFEEEDEKEADELEREVNDLLERAGHDFPEEDESATS